jgi:hypothetical protein
METGRDLGTGQRRSAARTSSSDGARTGTECGHSRPSVHQKQLRPWRYARGRWREKNFAAEHGNGTVDTQGLLLSVNVREADPGDRDAGKV